MNLDGLTHYWAFNSDYNDQIGGSTLFGAINITFFNDRNDKPYSAIFINQGYIQAPSANYFSGPSTIIFWINILNNGCSIFNFFSQFFQIYISTLTGSYTQISTFLNNTQTALNSPKSLSFGTWTHLVATMDQTYYKIYLNGSLASSKFYNNTLPANISKGYFTIGITWSLGNFIFDDLKIYKRVLNITEIQSDMKSL